MKKTPIFLTLIAATSLTIAAPQVDMKRIDAVVDYLTANQPDAKPEQKEALRRQVAFSFARNKILAEQALKAGLEQHPETQALLENARNEVLATRFVRYLEDETKINESELYAIYNRNTRKVRLEQVAFDKPEDALQAYDLLSKGMAFEELMKRFPNPQQESLNRMVLLKELPSEFAVAILTLNRGEITKTPVNFGNKYFVVKVAQEERDTTFPSFNEVKDTIAAQERKRMATERVGKLLRDNVSDFPEVASGVATPQ